MGEKENKKKLRNSILLGLLLGLLLCAGVYVGISAYLKNTDEAAVSSSKVQKQLEETEDGTDETVESFISDSEEVLIEKFGLVDDSTITVKAAGNEAVPEAANPNSTSASNITLLSEGIRYAKIVYPAGEEDAKVVALKLSDLIAEATGYHLEVASDDEAETTYEVLVGDTNREASIKTYEEMNNQGAAYAVNVTSKKVVLEAADSEGLADASAAMLKMATKADGLMTIKKNNSLYK